MQRRKIWRLPIVRGVIALGESLAIGFRALAISANVASQERDEDGEIQTQISRGQIIFSFAIAIGFALMLFKIGPALLTSWLPIESTDVLRDRRGADPCRRSSSATSSSSRCSRTCDACSSTTAPSTRRSTRSRPGSSSRRANVQKFSLIHPRCGTAFLLWVMVIAIFVFAFVGRPEWYWLIASRILLLPLIAGLAYELIRYAGKHQDNRFLMTLLAPGLWLQRLTTREPSDDQVEVSIRALRRVLESEAGGDARGAQARHPRRSHGLDHAANRSRGRDRLGGNDRARVRESCEAASSGAFELPVDDRLADRRSGGKDEPGGAPRRCARDLLRDVARQRARPLRYATGAA